MTVELFGYADPLTARPGSRVRVMVSDDRPGAYHATLVRLLAPDFGPSAPPMREAVVPHRANRTYHGATQTTPVGSYGVVTKPLAIGQQGQFTISLWFQPTLLAGRRQVLVSFQSGDDAFALALDRGEIVATWRRDGNETMARSGLHAGTHAWHLFAAKIDPVSGCVGFQLDRWSTRRGFETCQTSEASVPNLTALSGVAVSFAAAMRHGRACEHFDGKLESPRIYRRLLEPSALRRVATSDRARPDENLLAAWDFGPPIEGAWFRDYGPSDLPGMFVNCPARGVTGHSWDGSVFDYRFAPDQYGAVHFHSDDLADACWEPTQDIDLPAELSSGIYALKLEREGCSPTYVPFFVTAPRERRAQAALLVSTATFIAYGNHVARLTATRSERVSGATNVIQDDDLVLLDHPEFGLSTYDSHRDGSGVIYASRLRPMLNMKPTGRVWNLALDLRLVDWLDRHGIDIDIVTDEDLHGDGTAALNGYLLVLTGCHPEYVSTAMLDALDDFASTGGRLMYLGGNGFYWRIAFSEAFPGVIEVRRGKEGTRLWSGAVGEDHHSFTGEAGGTWRSLGRPPNALVGVGYVGQGFDCAAPYRRTPESRDPRVSFMFDGIEEEVLGMHGVVPGGAAGLEIDAGNPALGTPRHAIVVAQSFGHSNAYVPSIDELEVNYAGADASTNPSIRAEVVFYETAKGGAVFSTGSIAFVGSLGLGEGDPIDRLILNVLRRFTDPLPFRSDEPD